MVVDQGTRDLHAKIHSAGHLIDLAVARLSKVCNMKNTIGLLEKGIILLTDLTWSIKELLKTLKNVSTNSSINSKASSIRSYKLRTRFTATMKQLKRKLFLKSSKSDT